jgi:uncharacterized protein YdhG (YjbR/CyaY superfamily)
MRKKAPRADAKPSPRKPAADAKTTTPKAVEAYLDAIPESSRKTFEQLRTLVRRAAPPDAEEVISYGIPALRKKKILVWYGAFANHCSLFPGAATIDEFRDELKGLTVSKGTVQFPSGDPLPEKLIAHIVKARVVGIAVPVRSRKAR